MFCRKDERFGGSCKRGKQEDLGQEEAQERPVLGSSYSGFWPGSTSGAVVDLEGKEPLEELVWDSTKRQRVRVPSEDPITPIKAVPVRSEKGDFLQLPKVWSELEQCGPQSTLFLDDSELRIIQDLVSVQIGCLLLFCGWCC
jgi:hypothetical protein